MSKEIVLEIENTDVTCKKEELISNSDYFKAMLEGNFVERNKSRIKLEGVKLKAMNTILTLLWDETHIIENDDVLSVLETTCMLQFEKIRNSCLEKIMEMLKPENCMKIWHVTEKLDIRPLCIKAKAMALDEFLCIKDSEYLLELTVDEIYFYLGHVHLRTDNELTVFQTIMKWWYENHDQYENESNVLLKLLRCIDYRDLLENYLKEMMTFPDIASNSELTELFSCILLLKNDEPIDQISETCQETAKLLYKSTSRKLPLFPCILVTAVPSESKNKKMRVFADVKHKKKVVYYDYDLGEFKHFLDIDVKKSQSLDGFKLVGYKEFVFMYGGEYLIGKGDWNYNFWVYDTIRDRWERKCTLPYPRRHFETCMVGNDIYIIGGTGVFRVIQENMFWYNFKEDKWSSLITLPCFGRQLKCCNYLNQLFILNINNKCGYFFNEDTYHWVQKEMKFDDGIMSNESEFAIFSYKNSLYLKGKSLIEFTLKDTELVLVSRKPLPNVLFDRLQAVPCNNMVYTFYKYTYVDNDTYTLECYNLETDHIYFVFKEASSDTVIDVEADDYVVSSTLKLFSFQHYSLVEENKLINDSFE